MRVLRRPRGVANFALAMTSILLASIISATAVTDSTATARPDTLSPTLPGRWLEEVVVTAREGEGLTSASRIDRAAMSHLQPTSFADLLELLPGNISKNPAMGQANTISLRETGTLNASGQQTQNADYDISSLGTLFMVDGAPINGDANMQTVGTADDAAASARNITNRGVDMRAISTDNIESVEIVRGIPSAEYGNLTSGLVKINRLRTATPFTARFKADEYSKLFAAGKGFEWSGRPHTFNVDLGYLDSKSDPRNRLENYKRINGSARLSLRFDTDKDGVDCSVGIDYTGSFDNAKSDPDLSYNKTDIYKSAYHRVALTSAVGITLSDNSFFSAIAINASASLQADRLERIKQVAPQRASVAPTSMLPGEQPGEYLLSEYVAHYLSDGRPLNCFVKGKAEGSRLTGRVSHRYMAGVEWSISKNFGRGQVYDLRRPISAAWTSRPRDFRLIPALNVLSFFIEDEISFSSGAGTLTARPGLRSIQLPGLSRRYYLANRPYLDPRISVQWRFPAIKTARGDLMLKLSAGWGLTTKMPTLDYLFPQPHYTDIIQLNYYDVANPHTHSLISLRTYIDDAVNYSLRPARNAKREVSIGIGWLDNSLTLTYFNEKMSSGFRYSPVYAPYSYRQYDASDIDASTLSAPPELSRLPYVGTVVLGSYRRATNGTRIDKQGVEFTLTTGRWKALRTKLQISGAWMRTVYSNSEMLYSEVNDVVDGRAVSDRFVGLYDYRDGRVSEQFNTNFMIDTQIPRWGLVVTTSLQCMWWVKTRRLPLDGVPVSYLDAADGLLHPFDADATDNPLLRYLIKTYNDDAFREVKVPFAAYLNIKATKKIGRFLRIALFVNRILDWQPDYKANGLLIRRASDAYFGMEINLTL